MSSPAHTVTAPPGRGDAVRQSSLREQNLAVVCQTVFASADPLSRARLAAVTGMTRSTISRLAEELIAGGLLTEHDADGHGRRGRPAVPLAPAAGTVAGLGLHVNVDYLAGRAVDLAGAVLAEETVPGDFADSDPAEVLGRLGELAGRLWESTTRAGARVAGAVLGVPGLVDAADGKLVTAPNLGWREKSLADLLRGSALPPGLRIDVANDAHLAAYGVAHAAPGRRAERSSFVYLGGDIGVGGAIVSEGHVVRGRHGWAGEVGHVSIEPEGPVCHCGSRGCLEVYTGQRVMLGAAGLATGATTADLAAAARAGEPRAWQAVAQASWALGIALASTVNVADVDEIVLGTGFVPLVELMRPGIEKQLQARTLAGPRGRVRLRAAPENPLPAATGGAWRALETVIAAPAAWLGAGRG